MGTRTRCVGENLNDKEKAIVVQFSFYKDKTNILRLCKKLNPNLSGEDVRDVCAKCATNVLFFTRPSLQILGKIQTGVFPISGFLLNPL